MKVGSSVSPAFSVLSGCVEVVVVVNMLVLVVVIVFVVVIVVVVVVVLVDDNVVMASPTSLAHLTLKFSKVVDIGKHFPLDSVSIPISILR